MLSALARLLPAGAEVAELRVLGASSPQGPARECLSALSALLAVARGAHPHHHTHRVRRLYALWHPRCCASKLVGQTRIRLICMCNMNVSMPRGTRDVVRANSCGKFACWQSHNTRNSQPGVGEHPAPQDDATPRACKLQTANRAAGSASPPHPRGQTRATPARLRRGRRRFVYCVNTYWRETAPGRH